LCCDSADVYSLRFFEMISCFNLSRNTGCGDMFSCHFSFPLEKFRDSHFINPLQIPSRLFPNLSFTSYHRVGPIYISPCFVLLKVFSLFFILIVSYESVIAFLFWSFLLLYAVPCSRATSLKYEL